MAQGEFTKEEAEETKTAVQELFDAIPKTKRINFIGHLNDILLFLEAAKDKGSIRARFSRQRKERIVIREIKNSG